MIWVAAGTRLIGYSDSFCNHDDILETAGVPALLCPGFKILLPRRLIPPRMSAGSVFLLKIREGV